MGSYQTLTPARPVMQRERPATPVVSRDLIYGKKRIRPANVEPYSPPVREVEGGIILPKAITPQECDTNRITMQFLLRVCAETADIAVVEITSARRQVELVKIRHIFMWLVKQFTGQSYPQIGKRLGGRDHSTIIHGVRRAQRVIDHHQIKIANDPRLMAERLFSANWDEVRK